MSEDFITDAAANIKPPMLASNRSIGSGRFVAEIEMTMVFAIPTRNFAEAEFLFCRLLFFFERVMVVGIVLLLLRRDETKTKTLVGRHRRSTKVLDV